MEIIIISPKQLPTAGYNSILDFKLDDAVQIVHSFPDCNECKFALTYKGDGRNVFKNNFVYRAYCIANRVPIRIPLLLDKPISFSDLWLPWRQWDPSVGKMQNEKIFLYIPSGIKYI